MSHLKIDRTFLKDAPESAYDGALMEAIVNVGHKLDLFIVAEGVETAEQSRYCQELKVEYVQGFLYAKPMPARELEKLLHSNSTFSYVTNTWWIVANKPTLFRK